MRIQLRRTSAVAGVVVASLLASSVAALADGVTYDNPLTPRSELVTMETGVIDTADKGDRIRLANPYTDASAYRHLTSALGRGAVVHVVTMTPRTRGGWTDRLRSAIAAARNGSTIRICRDNSCGGRMHAKTLTVSHPDGTFKTVIASNDLVGLVPTREWNNAFSTSNRAIGRTVAHWIDGMRGAARRTTPRVVTANNLVYYTFPQYHDTARNNFYTRALAPVSCAHGTRVDLVTSLWNGMEALAQRVVSMQHRGCRMRVIVAKKRTDEDVLRILQRGRVPTHFSSSARDGQNIHSHAKIIAIDGFYRGKRQRTVYEGSLNMNLWIDRTYLDNMVRIVDASRGGIYGRTEDMIDAVWSYGDRVPRWARLSAGLRREKRIVEGLLAPAMGGQLVNLQRKYRDTWHTVAHGSTGRLGHVRFNMRGRPHGRWRLHAPGTKQHTRAGSRSFVWK